MSNSSLVDYVGLSSNCSKPRNNVIKKITIHHMSGNLSVETCANVFAPASRQASSNYGIGSDGRVGMYVEEKDRAWTSSNADNDNQAITIEVANDGGSPDWHVSDKALSKLISLCVDICKRNNIKKLIYTGDKTGNLTMHKMFAATDCPGPYLGSKFPYIVSQVNSKLGINTPSSVEFSSNGNGGSYYNVKEVQKMLTFIGYSCGSCGADGFWGNSTLAAVKAFQKDCNLKVDGWVGSDTYTKMTQEYAKKVSTSKVSYIDLDGKIGVVNALSGVNVRKEKSTNAEKLGVLPNGAKVRLYRKEGDWIHIYYPQHGGYVYRKYVIY